MLEDIPLNSSPSDTDSDWEPIDPQYDNPHASEDVRQSSYNAPATVDEIDEDDEVQAQMVPRRKPGGYDSRTEQILYENPALPILITDAGKSLESGGRYIVYTIRTGVRMPGPSCFLSLADEHVRISRFAGGTQSLPPFAMRSAGFTLPSSSRPSPRNILWLTTPPIRPMRSKISRSSICANACLPSS